MDLQSMTIWELQQLQARVNAELERRVLGPMTCVSIGPDHEPPLIAKGRFTATARKGELPALEWDDTPSPAPGEKEDR